MFFSRPKVDLPKVTAPTAAQVAARSKPTPEGQKLLEPGMTPGEYLGTLEKNKMSVDSVHFLAHGLPQQDSICWSAQSCRLVAPKLSAPELNALQLSEGWLKMPGVNMQAALAAALGGVDFTGPASWTAQAALWAQTPGMGGLVAAAVAGAILLAAGLMIGPAMPAMAMPKLPIPMLPPTPELLMQLKNPKLMIPNLPALNQPKLMKPMMPFLDLGHKVALGNIRCC